MSKKKAVVVKDDAYKTARINANKARRMEAHKRRMARNPADPLRGYARNKRRYDKQRAYAEAQTAAATAA